MRLVFLALVLCLGCGRLDSREIVVTSEAASDSAIARLTAQVEPAFAYIERITGLRDTEDLRLHLAGSARAFEQAARSDGVTAFGESVLGYAIPSRRRVVINLSGIGDRRMDPVGVLRHELAHLAMGSLLRVERPLWYEEGVCQYVESVALNELIEAAGGGGAFVSFQSLDDLSEGLRDGARVGAAYMEVREAVRLLVQKYGEAGLKRLMAELESGRGPFEAAFERATGDSLADFERAWQEDYAGRRGSRIALFFGAHAVFLLFAAAGVLLVVGLWIRGRRGKKQLDVWEEQEKYFPDDPSWSYAVDDDDSFSAGSDEYESR